MTSKRVVAQSSLWQLNRDILHCLYSEWLASWWDLSVLDRTFLGESDRKAWLTSLSGLCMTKILNRRMSDQAMKGWYQWVGSHKVLLVKDFPVRLSVLEDLLAVFDNNTECCPCLQSIEIVNDLYRERPPPPSLNKVHSWLEDTVSLFLTQCSHLQSMSLHTMRCDEDTNDQSNYNAHHLIEVESRLLSLLMRATLVKVDITFHSPSSPFYQQICNFLAHHLSTLRDLDLTAAGSASTRQTAFCFDEIMTFLIARSCPLRRLSLVCESLAVHGSVMDYLQVAGMYLEELELGSNSQVCNNLIVSDELLGSIGRACPRLRTLHLFTSIRQNMRKPSSLYTLCPDLNSFVIECIMDYSYLSVSMKVDDERHVVQFYDNCSSTREEMIDWCHCLYNILDRTQYGLVLTGYCKDFSSSDCFEWQSVKSSLSPYLCEIEAVLSESVLVEAMRDLPRLEKLEIEVSRHLFSDISLIAIIEYRNNLKVFSIHDYPSRPRSLFSDEMISKMIQACKGLECLKILGAGYESILAVRNHLALRRVCLENVKVEKARMITLLFTDQSKGKVWTLRQGEVKGDDYVFVYKPQKKSWTSMECEESR